MSEEIKIDIKSTYDGKGAKDAMADQMKLQQAAAQKAFPETHAKIQQLYKSAAVYESKGMPEAAKSARADAKVLQGDLDRWAKENVAAHKEVTKELKTQDTLAKGRQGFWKKIGQGTLSTAERVSGTPISGLNGAVGAGGPVAMVAAAVAAITAGIALSYGRRKEGEAVLGAEDRGERLIQKRRLKRQAGFEGTAASNREMEEGFRDDETAAIAEQGVIQEKKKWRWLHPTQWISNLTGEADAPERENQARQQRDVEGADKAKIQARVKYKEQVAPLIEAQKKLNEFKGAEARGIQDQVTMIQESDRLRAQKATPEEAAAGAAVKMTTIARERAGDYSKLVNARDGATDTARVASAAHEEVANAVNAMHSTVIQNHQQAIGDVTRKNFSRP